MKPLKEELEHMGKMGVLSRVQELTDWHADMFPIRNKNGQV